MNKTDLSKMGRDLLFTLEKHSPEILTGMGISSMFVAIGTAVSATKKATRRIDELEETRKTPLTKKEVVKETWPLYVPTAAASIFSAACILGANSEQAKRNAALATAYKLSETAFAEYKTQVVETIGEEKEKTVREKVAQKQVENIPIQHQAVYDTGKGDTLFVEPCSKRPFKSSWEEGIKKVENIINRRLMDEMFVSVNEINWELGLDSVEYIGDKMGWHVDQGYLDIGKVLAEDVTGKPCYMLTYDPEPEYKYNY